MRSDWIVEKFSCILSSLSSLSNGSADIFILVSISKTVLVIFSFFFFCHFAVSLLLRGMKSNNVCFPVAYGS